MAQELLNNNELDRMINNAFMSDTDLTIPSTLADKTIRKLEKRMLLQELMLELLFKAGLISGSLVLLAGVLLWFNGSGLLAGIHVYLAHNWQFIFSVLFLLLMTIFIDQVILKFYLELRKKVSVMP
jgi:hypothetical protein